MKKNENATKITLLYDKLSFTAIAIGFFVMLFFHILQITFKWQGLPDSSPYIGRYHLQLQTLPYLLFPIFLFQLRFRTITPKGIYATFFGIPYKHILWENVDFCKIDSAYPLIRVKGADNVRNMLFFKSKLNSRYKATIISIDATPEVIALVKKYYKKEIYDLTQMEEE